MANPDMLFDINFKDAEIHEALEDFFRQAGRPFEFDEELSGVVSVRAADLSFRDALRLILPENWDFIEIGDVYHLRQGKRAA